MEHLQQKYDKEIEDLAALLLDIGNYLMSYGACTNRIRVTIDRISEVYGYSADLLITNRAIMITVCDEEDGSYVSRLKRTLPHGVNFKVVSGISRMSWHVVEESWSIEQIRAEVDRLVALPSYNRLVILSAVALAGASFCRLFGGTPLEMLVTFVATFVGLFVRQEAYKIRFNSYLCILFASFVASVIAGFGFKIGLSNTIEHSFAASVLFLIPGIPLINSFTDIIDGNILNGIVRGFNAFVIIFMVALGLLSAMVLYQF